MSLDSKDLANLVSYLHPERIAGQPLETISNIVSKQFNKSDHFKVCRILAFLLQYKFINDNVSRFVALFLIWDMYKSESINNSPFVSFVAAYLQNESSLNPGTVFVFHSLLTQPEQVNEFLSYTPQQILSLTNANINSKLDWSFLQRNDLSGYVPRNAGCSITCVVPDKDVNTSNFQSTPSEQRQHTCLNSVFDGNYLLEGEDLKPELLRVTPPLLPCPQGVPQTLHLDSSDPTTEYSGWSEELIWLNPHTVEHQFHWDATVGDANPTSQLRRLMYIAFTSSLPQNQMHTVLQAIKDNPSVMLNVGVTPDNLPILIERNPVIALELLPLLVKSPQKLDYYNALVSMEMTVNSLESVNRLTTKVNLPTDFLHLYLSKCMRECQAIVDKGVQMRHVRLVCVLIQSLIRNKILVLSSENILIEVQAFCVEFMKVTAASTLYRLIKNMESSVSPAGATGNGGSGDLASGATCSAKAE